MNHLFTNQESISGCESGWTLYLDHSSITPRNQEHDYVDGTRTRSLSKKRLVKGKVRVEEEEIEYEDLSMVSDASSGPPHFNEEKEGYFGNGTNGCYNQTPKNSSFSKNRRNTKENRHSKIKDQSSLLDDTASSPLLDYSNKNCLPTRGNVMEEYSQGYSTTQFELRPPYNEHCDFFQSSISGNQLQQNQWSEGKR